MSRRSLLRVTFQGPPSLACSGSWSPPSHRLAALASLTSPASSNYSA